jgi:hypothetical protein
LLRSYPGVLPLSFINLRRVVVLKLVVSLMKQLFEL